MDLWEFFLKSLPSSCPASLGFEFHQRQSQSKAAVRSTCSCWSMQYTWRCLEPPLVNSWRENAQKRIHEVQRRFFARYFYVLHTWDVCADAFVCISICWSGERHMACRVLPTSCLVDWVQEIANNADVGRFLAQSRCWISADSFRSDLCWLWIIARRHLCGIFFFYDWRSATCGFSIMHLLLCFIFFISMFKSTASQGRSR